MSPAEAYLKNIHEKPSYWASSSFARPTSPAQSEIAARGMSCARSVPSAYVPNHLAGAIITTLFCCLIGGIVAIVYACKVNTMLAAGDIEGAKAASATARTWIIVNIVTGLLPLIIYFFLVIGAFL